MENIVPCQLQSYFALLYKQISLEQLIKNKPLKKNQTFKQILVWKNGNTETNWLPKLKAPTSAVQFWINHLKLKDNKYIESFQEGGYSSVQELIAEMIGYYNFYTVPRYFDII